MTSANVDGLQSHLPSRILIIDDSADLRVLLVRFLSGQGYQTSEAKNGKAALEILKTSLQGELTPDLILLDSEMEIMNGSDFLLEFEKTLPEAFANVLVVGLSGLNKFTHPKIFRTLRKPVDLDRLINAITLALASSGCSFASSL